MPKDEDPTGSLGYKWHDSYWSSHFKSIESSIASLKESSTCEVIVPDGLAEAIKHPYPLVMGSKNLHPRTVAYNSTEKCCEKSALLGKDIQIIFVEEKNTEHLRSFLKGHGLESKITLIDMESLSAAVLLNQLASPYFADIASRKKITALTLKRSSERNFNRRHHLRTPTGMVKK